MFLITYTINNPDMLNHMNKAPSHFEWELYSFYKTAQAKTLNNNNVLRNKINQQQTSEWKLTSCPWLIINYPPFINPFSI